MLDEAVPGLQVKDVAAVEQAVNDEQRRRDPDLFTAVAPKISSPLAPHNVLGSQADVRRSDGAVNRIPFRARSALRSTSRRTRSTTLIGNRDRVALTAA